jgi:adenylate kinase
MLLSPLENVLSEAQVIILKELNGGDIWVLLTQEFDKVLENSLKLKSDNVNYEEQIYQLESQLITFQKETLTNSTLLKEDRDIAIKEANKLREKCEKLEHFKVVTEASLSEVEGLRSSLEEISRERIILMERLAQSIEFSRAKDSTANELTDQLCQSQEQRNELRSRALKAQSEALEAKFKTSKLEQEIVSLTERTVQPPT